MSWGASCAQQSAYGVYTRISAHADWLRQNVQGARALKLDDVPAPTSPTSKLVESAFLSLNDLLPGAFGRAAIGMRPAMKLRLGESAIFSVRSGVEGRLLLIDVNAEGNVAQLYPNPFSDEARLAPGGEFAVPDQETYRFPAQEPTGSGKLIALVVPDTFNMKALQQAKGTRGFGVAASLPYLQNLINLIRIARGPGKGFGIEATGTTSPLTATETAGWALADLDYEIRR